MPFLLPLLPALAGGAAAAGGGALVNAITGGGGRQNAGFSAQSADLQNPTTNAQAQNAYQQAQSGLGQQQAFTNAVAPGGAQGLGNQAFLGNQLQQQAQGKGPNVAMNQLNQTTAANNANITGALASQRGASANPAALARTAALAGAQNQQQAAGQAATLRAQQQIAAQQALGNLAQQQVGQQATGLQNLNTFQQGEQGHLLGSIAAQNQAAVGNASQMNAANQPMANANAQRNNNLIGGVMGGIGSAVTGLFNPSGSGTPQTDSGFTLPSQGSSQFGQAPSGNFGGLGGGLQYAEGGEVSHQSNVGRHLSSMASGGQVPMAEGGHVEHGKVPALLSPGEKYLTPEQAKDVKAGKASPMEGKTVPGVPKTKGDNYANDTVPATLQEGGVVIPKSVMESDKPMQNAIKFVHAHMRMAKGGKVKSRGKK